MSLQSKILMGFSLLNSKIRNSRFPFMVNWAITGRCNLRCKHCYGKYGVVQNEEVSFDMIKKTIDALKEMGTRRITIEGGEPLIRTDIKEVIDYIYKKKIEMSLCTNGSLLGEHADFLKEKVDLLVLSLEGRESYHDSLRGHGNFSKVLNALEIAGRYGMRTLIFSCLIDNNINDVDYLVEIAKKFNVSIAFNIGVAQITKDNERKGLNKASNDAYRTAVLKILEHKRRGAPIFYSEKNFFQAIAWPTFSKERYFNNELSSLNREQKRKMIPCYAGINYCYIECDGSVYPCYQLVGLLKVKNIAIDGIKESFDYLSQISLCRHCYNFALSELNLQCKLDIRSVLKVIKNYTSLSKGGTH